jgi:hypothetical protein
MNSHFLDRLLFNKEGKSTIYLCKVINKYLVLPYILKMMASLSFWEQPHISLIENPVTISNTCEN